MLFCQDRKRAPGGAPKVLVFEDFIDECFCDEFCAVAIFVDQSVVVQDDSAFSVISGIITNDVLIVDALLKERLDLMSALRKIYSGPEVDEDFASYRFRDSVIIFAFHETTSFRSYSVCASTISEYIVAYNGKIVKQA